MNRNFRARIVFAIRYTLINNEKLTSVELETLESVATF